MEPEKMPEWLKKCITCNYAYKKKDDDDCFYCRRKNGECKYKAKHAMKAYEEVMKNDDNE